jgi:hypothetical protein
LVRPRVLLADDHPALLEAITALLKARFDAVGTATDGASLVSEALRLCPDVIVTDITMPILSGIDAAHWLRESAFPAQNSVPDDPLRRAIHEGVHGRRRIGICPQVPYESPLDSSDTSGPCRTIVHLSIRPHVMSERKIDNVHS